MSNKSGKKSNMRLLLLLPNPIIHNVVFMGHTIAFFFQSWVFIKIWSLQHQLQRCDFQLTHKIARFGALPYQIVWATKLLLAAICLVFPALVLGYKLFNCSIYHIPVPTLFG